MKKKKATPGQPPKYKTAEQLQKKIDWYFEHPPMRQVVVGPPNNRTTVNLPCPTITGLCLFLGFESRQSFYDMEKREGFSYTIKKARLQMESFYEESGQLNNSTFSIFALKNFGWIDKQVIAGEEDEPLSISITVPSKPQGGNGKE